MTNNNNNNNNNNHNIVHEEQHQQHTENSLYHRNTELSNDISREIYDVNTNPPQTRHVLLTAFLMQARSAYRLAGPLMDIPTRFLVIHDIINTSPQTHIEYVLVRTFPYGLATTGLSGFVIVHKSDISAYCMLRIAYTSARISSCFTSTIEWNVVRHNIISSNSSVNESPNSSTQVDVTRFRQNRNCCNYYYCLLQSASSENDDDKTQSNDPIIAA